MSFDGAADKLARLVDAPRFSHQLPRRTCGDTSPCGTFACNRPPHQQFDHYFSRDGQLIAKWPNRLEAEQIDVSTFQQGLGHHFVPGSDPLEQGRALASALAADLGSWWEGKARDEIERTVPKAVEYGSTDLVDIGRDLARCAGREVTDEEAAELGIYFYLRGKLARWTDAVIRGVRVSDDTLFDIGVYVRMAQRVRSHGGWPGTNKEGAQ